MFFIATSAPLVLILPFQTEVIKPLFLVIAKIGYGFISIWVWGFIVIRSGPEGNGSGLLGISQPNILTKLSTFCSISSLLISNYFISPSIILAPFSSLFTIISGIFYCTPKTSLVSSIHSQAFLIS